MKENEIAMYSIPLGNFLTKTKMCKTVLLGQVCRYGKNCLFAHNYKNLHRIPCAFRDNCCLVKMFNSNTYINSSTKVCGFWHPNESFSSYISRQNYPKKLKIKSV
jgi:hypothetical protein